MVRFECRRCGYCECHLINVFNGITFGLYLSPEEVGLFPRDLVQPLFRNGDKIIAYQLVTNECPHYYKEDNKACCRIYNDRPVGCRSFPLKGLREVETELCRFTREHKDEEWDFSSFEVEIEGVKKQLEEIIKYPQATEIYLFDIKKWISYDRL